MVYCIADADRRASTQITSVICLICTILKCTKTHKKIPSRNILKTVDQEGEGRGYTHQLSAEIHEHQAYDNGTFRQATGNPGGQAHGPAHDSSACPHHCCCAAANAEARKPSEARAGRLPPSFQTRRISANGRRNFKIPHHNERDPPPFRISNTPLPTPYFHSRGVPI
jgi:hypothetical protein